MRFRCQECGRLVREGGRKCSGCGSYDIDIDVPTPAQLRKLRGQGLQKKIMMVKRFQERRNATV